MNDTTQIQQYIRKAQHGDAEAFLELVRPVKERLFRVAIAYLHRKDLALLAIEDMTCDAFLHIRQLKKPEYAVTWLTRILINSCLKQLRREKRETPVETLPEFPVQDEAKQLELKDAVCRLPSDLRAVISVRYFGDLSVPETAIALGLPEGTVKTRLRKALSLLKVDLEVE
jgi:RNA polymerase sigma factor (sigma-70 family)